MKANFNLGPYALHVGLAPYVSADGTTSVGYQLVTAEKKCVAFIDIEQGQPSRIGFCEASFPYMDAFTLAAREHFDSTAPIVFVSKN